MINVYDESFDQELHKDLIEFIDSFLLAQTLDDYQTSCSLVKNGRNQNDNHKLIVWIQDVPKGKSDMFSFIFTNSNLTKEHNGYFAGYFSIIIVDEKFSSHSFQHKLRKNGFSKWTKFKILGKWGISIGHKYEVKCDSSMQIVNLCKVFAMYLP